MEMLGFKSFPEKISVEFDRGITAIVGPNGSGKSNISDAVRWVLGEQSARTLRGAKMEDVIFAGTQRRRPVNYAQVTLVLDNSDKKIPIEYDEVSISRRVYRSGESEYTVNQNRCRLKDVQELLMDTGIGKDGYSVIGQGQIDQLLSTKPQERRLIFEEAAGIVKYKTRKETAIKELEEERANLNRVQDILEEIASRLGPLREQAEVAQKYVKLKDELKIYEINAFLGQYKQYREQYQRLLSQQEDLGRQMEASRREQEEAKARSAQYAAAAQQVQQTLSQMYDEMTQMKVRKETAEGNRRVDQQKKDYLQKELESAQKRLDDTKSKLSARAATVRKEEERREQLSQDLNLRENRMTLLSEAEKNLSEEASQVEASLEKHTAALSAVKASLTDKQNKAQRHEIVLEQGRSRQESLESRSAQLCQERQEKEAALQELDRKLKSQEEMHEQVERELAALTEQVGRLRQTIRDKQKEEEEIVAAIRADQSRIQWLQDLERDYEGFSNSVKSIMSLRQREPQRWQKIHGTLADVISVPSHLAVAMEIALGPAIQNIITEDQECAKALIEYLRSRNGGRATFQPLDTVTGRAPFAGAQKVKAMPGVLGFANELVQYHEQYGAILSRLLGYVVVAEDFDTAAAISKEYGNVLRVVTLKGDIFNIGGSITGGSTGNRAGNILSRKGELDTLARDIEDKRAEGRAMQQEVAALSAERQRQAQAVDEAAAKRDEAAASLSELQKQRDQLLFVLEHIRQEQSGLDEDKRSLLAQVEEHQESMAKYQEDIAALELQSKEETEQVRRLQEAVAGKSREKEDLKAQLMQVRIDVSGVRQQIQSLERTMGWERQEIENLTQDAEGILEEMASHRAEEKELEQRLLSLEKEQRDLTEQIQERTQRLKALEAERDERDRKRDEGIREAEETLRNFSTLEKEQVRLENLASRAKKDLTDLQDRIWEEYEMTYNVAAAMEQEELGSSASIARRITQLKEQIKALGDVHVGAITEYAALTERCDFLTAQRDDILKAEQSLQDIIERLTKQMEEQFVEGFTRIAELFNQVFQKLFGGGRGILRLAEGEGVLEAGIEIIAQPPGKKLQSMMLLSGGEKALTAIALLFAIQQLNPAPFCILDEIEAALDDANVVRFANYLKELCGRTQFIVITHRKGTMEAAHTMYGITMEEKGVSKCISVKFE